MVYAFVGKPFIYEEYWKLTTSLGECDRWDMIDQQTESEVVSMEVRKLHRGLT